MGPSALGARRSAAPQDAPSAERRGPSAASLVVQTSFLGDVVLTTPLIAHLARGGPVDVVTTPASASLLANNPAVREVIVYDKRRRDSGVRGLLRVASVLRGRGYDAAYLAQGSMRSAALAVAARTPERVGFDTSAGRRLYTVRVAYDRTAHQTARLLALGRGDDASAPAAEALRPRLYPGAADVSAVDRLLREAGHRGEPLAVLAPGSVWATKRWPYYPALAHRLADRYRLAVVGSGNDTPLARAIAAAVGPQVIDATGRLSLLASAALIGRAALIVTNDSAPQHIASAMGTPTVTIFGPTGPGFGFGPLAPHSRAAELAELSCHPCHPHGPARCPLGHWRCMRELDAQRVVELARRTTTLSTLGA